MAAREQNVAKILEKYSFFEFAGYVPGRSSVPRFRHKILDIGVILIPAGRFTMGLSKQEEIAARRLHDPIHLDVPRMKPPHQVRVCSVLVTEYPLVQTVDSRLSDRTMVLSKAVSYPATVSYQQAVDFAESHCARLPKEEEWEYMCRAGTKSLFFWGDTLPNSRELDKLLQFDMSKSKTPNPFGLFGVFAGEWCMGRYRSDYSTHASFDDNSHPIRGGASQLWPWQSDKEWAWCVSANRMPSTELFDGRACFRLVWEL